MTTPQPLPSNMAMTTVRGRYGKTESNQFVPFVGMLVRFSPAYPFVTNTTALPSPLVIATAPRTLQTDADGYLSDPDDGFDAAGMGLNRNAKIISSDDPDIQPHDWPYLVTFSGPGATNFRAFRTPLQSEAVVDIAVLTPQRVPAGSTPTQAEIAAANAAASAAAAQAAVAGIRRGQAGGVAALDADGDVNNAAGQKVLPGGGGGGGTPALADITGMSVIGKQLVATQIGGVAASASLMRGVLGAGTGNSNLAIGTTAGTAADAAATNTAIAAKATDSTVLHKTGDESKDGVLTFTSPPKIPAATADDNPVTRAQMTTAIAAGGGGGGGFTGTINPSTQITGATDVGVGVLTAAGASLAARKTAARQAIDAVGIAEVPTLVGGFISWAQMPPGTSCYMESPTGTMIPRLTARDDIKGIWIFPASTPPSLGGGLNAHDGDFWEVEVLA